MAGEGGIVVVILLAVLVLWSIWKAVVQVREKENVVIERLGRFHKLLTPGVHFIAPWIDRPKRFHFEYAITENTGRVHNKSVSGTRIATQNEVMDFPKQAVITRDNARIYIDAVLNYKVVQAKTMIYSTQNLPNMLSKILQAQIRNVAGTLDVDQIIEDNACMDRVGAQISETAARWGVSVEFVKIQHVDAGVLAPLLSKKKKEDLKNKEVIIQAKATKQTRVIESEGQRDRMVREAEGECQQIVAQARGTASAIVNAAEAELRSVAEIARAIAKSGENPTKYMLALKYLEALRKIASSSNTTVRFLPYETTFLQTAQSFGLNTIHGRA